MANRKSGATAPAEGLPAKTDLKQRLHDQVIPFLACLNQSDPCDALNHMETWQTFDDDKISGNKRLAGHWNEGLGAALIELERRNEAGAGIFVTVNATDGKGRKKGNIRAIRGWHARFGWERCRRTIFGRKPAIGSNHAGPHPRRLSSLLASPGAHAL